MTTWSDKKQMYGGNTSGLYFIELQTPLPFCTIRIAWSIFQKTPESKVTSYFFDTTLDYEVTVGFANYSVFIDKTQDIETAKKSAENWLYNKHKELSIFLLNLAGGGELANQMKNPKIIGFSDAQTHTYQLPTYKVEDDGIKDGEGAEIKICKGNKDDANAERQEGVFVESLLTLVKTHLERVNVGDLSSRETSVAITKVDEALMWLNKRSEDRQLRGVQGTYQK